LCARVCKRQKAKERARECEREKETEEGWERARGIERERERARETELVFRTRVDPMADCVCVCACVCVCVCVCVHLFLFFPRACCAMLWFVHAHGCVKWIVTGQHIFESKHMHNKQTQACTTEACTQSNSIPHTQSNIQGATYEIQHMVFSTTQSKLYDPTIQYTKNSQSPKRTSRQYVTLQHMERPNTVICSSSL